MLLNVEDYRRQAKLSLPGFVFDYVDGAADDGHCLRRNRSDFDEVRLVPRVLRDTGQVDPTIKVLGTSWQHPFGIAPTGLNGLLRPGGDAMLARAAAKAGIPFVQSTASNMRLEDVRAAAPQALQWMQLYVMHRTLAERIVQRAQGAGFQVLVLTVDVPVSGNRELDARNGFRLPFRPTPRLAWDVMTHPRWALRMARAGAPEFANLSGDDEDAGSAEMQAALLARAMDRTLVWDSLRWLRQSWPGPLVLKGVLHPDDARLAIDHGVDGLIVSNHGGRQLDASPSAISTLPGIARAVGGRIPVFLDSGVRRGGDIAKAIALGADAVFLGRPLLYGLAAGGQAGAEAVLNLFIDDFMRAMVLLGASRVSDLHGSAMSAHAA